MKKIFCFTLMMSAFTVMFSGCVNEEFGGLGIEVPTRHEMVSKTNPFIIVSVFKNGPAESAGLRTGDSIVTIDGRSLDGLYEDYIVKNLLRGKIGTQITLEIERGKGGEKKNMLFRIPRVRIVLQE
jgi:C-terminal processing protease CtpA/Prc